MFLFKSISYNTLKIRLFGLELPICVNTKFLRQHSHKMGRKAEVNNWWLVTSDEKGLFLNKWQGILTIRRKGEIQIHYAVYKVEKTKMNQ